MHATALTGDLAVASIYSAGIELLESAREGLEQRHPGSSITIRYRNPSEVERLVANGECELGIVSYPKRLRGLQHQLLREEALVFVASPEHALLANDPEVLQVEDLAGQAMLSLEPSLPLAREIRQYLRRHAIAIEAGDTFDNIDTLLHALGPSRRCAILPEQTVVSAVEAGQVVTCVWLRR